MKDGQNPDQSPYDNLPDAAATYAVGGMATHWTAAVPRQHPDMERTKIINEDEWNELYKESEKLLKKSDKLFDDSIRNTIVRDVLKTTYKKEITESEYLPQNLPLAGVRKNEEFVMWSGSDTILGEDLVKKIKAEKHSPIKLKVGECALVTRGGLNKILYGEVQPQGPTPYLYKPFLKEKVPHFVYLLLTNGTTYTSLERCIPFNFCKYTVIMDVARFSTSCRPG